jgi:hypothetical protein
MRALLCFLLALPAAPAWAELLKVAETAAMVVHIDVATIRKDKQLRRVWAVLDYRQKRDDGLMSRRVLGEFDCTAHKLRILSMFNHLQPMARGPAKPVGNDPAILTDVEDSTPAGAVLKVVCAD